MKVEFLYKETTFVKNDFTGALCSTEHFQEKLETGKFRDEFGLVL